MAICGFNEKMLKGLSAFNEGLVEYGLLYRSKQNGESVEQGIKREISDMTRLLSELHRIDDAAKTATVTRAGNCRLRKRVLGSESFAIQIIENNVG